MTATPDQAKTLIVNRALVMLGVAAAYSTDAESRIGAIADMAWQNVAARVFSPPFNWADARATRDCIPLADTPQNGWAKGYELPGDRIGPPLAVLSQAGQSEVICREFRREGGHLYTNTPQAWVRIRIMLSPEIWDEGFANAFVTALAAALAVPLREDEDRESQLNGAAFGDPRQGGVGGLFGALLSADRAASQQTGRGFMDNDPLTMARFG